MNNGILFQDIYGKTGFEERLPKNTLGSPGVIPLPYYFPPNNDWKINTINLILVYDTSLSPGTTIHVPSANSSEQNIIIDWDDGVVENFIGQTATLTRTHTYSKHGIYKVQIYGTLGSTAARGLVGNGVPQNSASKLIAVLSFGNLDYAGTSTSTSTTNLYRAFYNAINLKNIPATLSSNVKILERTFEGCFLFNDPNISYWNTSNITNMNNLFLGCSNFNQPLDNWNVRKVTSFSSMFQGATSFNSSLSGWAPGADTTGTTCEAMFFSATNFTGIGLDSWDTSKVTNMRNMLRQTSFNTNIGAWNVSKVTNMENMFYFTGPFNQDISSWNLAGLNINSALDNFMGGKTGSTALSTANYDALLIGWNNNKLATANEVANWRSDLRPNFGGAKYTSGGAAAAARAALVSYGWTITDGGAA